jgi:ABC-type uncharacterized transport system substrate-binding protein
MSFKFISQLNIKPYSLVMHSVSLSLLLFFSSNIAYAIDSTVNALEKKRIFIVSSYHKEYLWSQSTRKGLLSAMRVYSYLDNDQQATSDISEDTIQSSRMIARWAWMDTKRFSSKSDMAKATERIIKQIALFKPDLVFLGDDNATNYIGNQLLDTSIPVVFWGINGLPLKYGLVDSMDRPGHNITGVWQAGYHKEGLDLLHRLLPGLKTFAILACDSVTSISNIKQIQALDRRGKLPLKLTEVVRTNSLEEFKRRALELNSTVDAFFILNHDTLRDNSGNHVDMLDVGRWYLENISLPEVSHEGQFVREGILLTANDSGFNQAYTAFEMAYDILEQGLNPGLIRTKTPPHGPLMVNINRANALGINLSSYQNQIDEIITESKALEP